MKKILFLTPNLGRGGGGAERQLTTVAIQLKKAGHDVEVYCFDEGDFYSDLLLENEINIIWQIEPNPLKRMIKVRRTIRRGNYNVVISFLSTPNFLNCFAAVGGKNWKVIAGERSAKESSFKGPKMKVFAWFMRRADAIVCNSENAKSMWIKHYPKYKDKMRVVYNNVNLQQITSEYIPKKDGKLHVIVAASYQYLKNPIGVVKALAMMDEEERNRVHVDWYGKNDDYRKTVYEEALSLAEKENLRNIELHPVSSEMHNLINAADVCALFSSVEGLPNAICEGMTLGKPIIMSRCSDYSVLVDETNGFLCDWDDFASIKNALLSAANLSDTQLADMGICSKRKADVLFSESIIRDKWISIVEN